MILLVLASFRTTSTGRFPRFPTFHTKYSEKMDVSFSKFSCFLALHLLLRLLYWKQDGFTRIKQTYGINNVGLTHSSLLLFFFFLNLDMNVQQVNLLRRRTHRILDGQRGCMMVAGLVL